MKITLNGQVQEFGGPLTIAALLQDVHAVAERVAVMVNGEIVRRPRHGEVMLNDGDTVEILTMVAGG
jgi:thiamine biosynthesis protein ThiS